MKNSRLVALVDTNAAHRQRVAAALMSFYDTTLYDEPQDALKTMALNQPAVILVSPEVKPMGSIDFIRAVREHEILMDTPVIFISESEIDPNAAKAREVGASNVITKPYTRSTLIQTISEEVSENVENEWKALPEPQRKALESSVDVFRGIADVLITGESIAFDDVKANCQSLVDVVESNSFKDILDGVRNHDDYTYAHSMRVATLLTLLGHAAGFNNNDQLIMSSGGLLHDVGKMMIPHNILNKPGKLTEEEFEIMKSHVPETMTYLKRAGNIPKGVMIIAEQHHEKIDGTGYPHGLKGGELNELARMAAIVDVFSALTDRRVYKDPMPSDKAMDIITNEMAGNHLDPHFVKLFRTVLVDAGIL